MNLSCSSIQRICTLPQVIDQLIENLGHLFATSLPSEVEQAKQILITQLIRRREVFSPYWGNDPYRPYRNPSYKRIGIKEVWTDDPYLAVYAYLEESRVLSPGFVAEEISRLLNKKHLPEVRTLRVLAGPVRYHPLDLIPGKFPWLALRAFYHMEGPPEVCSHCNHSRPNYLAKGYYFIAFCTGVGTEFIQADWLLVQVLSVEAV